MHKENFISISLKDKNYSYVATRKLFNSKGKIYGFHSQKQASQCIGKITKSPIVKTVNYVNVSKVLSISNNLDVLCFKAGIENTVKNRLRCLRDIVVSYDPVEISLSDHDLERDMSRIKHKSLKVISVMVGPRPTYTSIAIENTFLMEYSQSKALDWFKSLQISDFKSRDSKKVQVGDIKINYTLSGMRGANPGLYHDVISVDVEGMYPSMSVNFDLHPAQLDGDAYKLFLVRCLQDKFEYQGIRRKIAKLKSVYVYGKSRSPASRFYDPWHGLMLVVNAQLMVTELLKSLQVHSSSILVSTDQIIFKPQNQKECEKAMSSWESKTGLSLSRSYHKKMVIKSSNDYMSDKVSKGLFSLKTLPQHVPNNLAIIKAIRGHFFDKTDIRETILSNDNVFDYCTYVQSKNGFLKNELQSSTVSSQVIGQTSLLYFHSKSKSSIHKIQGNKTKSIINNWTDFKTKESSIFEVDKEYYIDKAKYILSKIECR